MGLFSGLFQKQALPIDNRPVPVLCRPEVGIAKILKNSGGGEVIIYDSLYDARIFWDKNVIEALGIFLADRNSKITLYVPDDISRKLYMDRHVFFQKLVDHKKSEIFSLFAPPLGNIKSIAFNSFGDIFCNDMIYRDSEFAQRAKDVLSKSPSFYGMQLDLNV